MWIKVVEGYVLRDPRTRTIIPPEGLAVDEGDLFYAKRLAEGSVVEADPPVED